jgi:cytochrome d ubiquinol oxidase subunit II
VIVQIALVILGWGIGMRAYIVYPDVALTAAGTRSETLSFLGASLPLGIALLLPSLWILFRIFKDIR